MRLPRSLSTVPVVALESGQVAIKIDANQVSTEDYRAVKISSRNQFCIAHLIKPLCMICNRLIFDCRIKQILGLSFLRKRGGVAGSTGVGSILEVGAGVRSLSAKDKVLVVTSGTWANTVTVPATSVMKIPDNLSIEESASLPAALSAYAILSNFVTLKAGDVVVQSGGDSAVGKAITQLGAAKGLKVMSATSAEFDDAGFAKKVAALGNVKLTISNTSKKNITKSLVRCLAADGSLVLYAGDGVMDDEVDGIDVPVGSAIFKKNSIYGFEFSSWVHSDRANVEKALAVVIDDIKTKKLVLKSKVFPQSDYLKALTEVQTTGGASVLLKL